MQTYHMTHPFIGKHLAELSAMPSKMVLAWAIEEGGKTKTGLILVPVDAEVRDFVAADEDAANAVNLVLLELPRLYRRRIWHIQADSLHGSDHDDKAPQRKK